MRPGPIHRAPGVRPSRPRRQAGPTVASRTATPASVRRRESAPPPEVCRTALHLRWRRRRVSWTDLIDSGLEIRKRLGSDALDLGATRVGADARNVQAQVQRVDAGLLANRRYPRRQ